MEGKKLPQITLALISYLLLIFSVTSFGKELQNKANTRGIIGEHDPINLIDDGFLFSPMTNDWAGQTDKLMTGSSRLSYLKSWSDSSFMLTGYWRSLTPVYKKKFGQSDLKTPFGRFADWAEVQGTYLKEADLEVPYGSLNYSMTLGLGHIGNKGLKHVHYYIHKTTNNSLLNLEYHNQPEGSTFSLGSEVGYLLDRPYHALVPWDIKLSGGIYRSKMMTEAYTGFNIQSSIYGQRIGFDGRLVKQLASGIYEQIKLHRFEFSSGILIQDTVLFSVKYVSPYLSQDNVRQIYADLSLNFDLGGDE